MLYYLLNVKMLLFIFFNLPPFVFLSSIFITSLYLTKIHSTLVWASRPREQNEFHRLRAGLVWHSARHCTAAGTGQQNKWTILWQVYLFPYIWILYHRFLMLSGELLRKVRFRYIYFWVIYIRYTII